MVHQTMKTSRASATAASASNHMRASMRHFNRAAGAIEILFVALAVLAPTGCAVLAPQSSPPPAPTAPPAATTPSVQAPPTTEPVKPSLPDAVVKPPPVIEPGALRPAAWSDLPGWQTDD